MRAAPSRPRSRGDNRRDAAVRVHAAGPEHVVGRHPDHLGAGLGHLQGGSSGAFRHGGAAFIDVISPCVAFNNHAGSTRSYDYVREHNEAVSRIDFIDLAHPATVEPGGLPPGEVFELPQPDGGLMRLRKLHEGYDPADRVAAMTLVQALQAQGEVPTGLLYIEPKAHDLHTALGTTAKALNTLDETALCPGSEALAKINASLR